MGTRADFYCGRGKDAEWLGSIAYDGYPEGNPKPVIPCSDESDFRRKVSTILAEEHKHATLPKDGWPWPWDDSGTTDYAYAFDEGKVWCTCFGDGWMSAKAALRADDYDRVRKDKVKVEWPEMQTDRAAKAGSNRSGIMVIGTK